MVEKRRGVPHRDRPQPQREAEERKRERKVRRGAKPDSDENAEEKSLDSPERGEKGEERHASV